jgi:transcriptional regulator with XRE-family HTH domain
VLSRCVIFSGKWFSVDFAGGGGARGRESGRGDVEFSEWLTERLEEKGWPRAKLAQTLGITAPSVTKWTQGRTIPEARHIPALATAFGVPEAEVRRYYPALEPHEPPEDWRDLRLREIIPFDDEFAAAIEEDDVVLFTRVLRATGVAFMCELRAIRIETQQAVVRAKHSAPRDRPAPTARSAASTTADTPTPLDREPRPPLARRNGSG